MGLYHRYNSVDLRRNAYPLKRGSRIQILLPIYHQKKQKGKLDSWYVTCFGEIKIKILLIVSCFAFQKKFVVVFSFNAVIPTHPVRSQLFLLDPVSHSINGDV